MGDSIGGAPVLETDEDKVNTDEQKPKVQRLQDASCEYMH